MSLISILSTVESKEDAINLATLLVENKHAACVNVASGITSVYFWEGTICKEEEYLIIIKTTENKRSEVFEFIKNNHPYQTPEIICNKIDLVDSDYLTWIKDSLNR